MIFDRFLSGLLHAEHVLAQIQPSTPCAPPMVCNPNPITANFISNATFPQLGGFLLRVAAGLGIVMIAWSGIQMLLALGDESKITKAKWGIVYAMAGLTFALMSQVFVGLLVTENYGQWNTLDIFVSGALASALRIMLTLLNVVFAICIVVLGIRMVLSQGKQDEFNTARKGILWAIVGAIVVNISNALIRAVLSFFGI